VIIDLLPPRTPFVPFAFAGGRAGFVLNPGGPTAVVGPALTWDNPAAGRLVWENRQGALTWEVDVRTLTWERPGG
jgi:hypothetical protein